MIIESFQFPDQGEGEAFALAQEILGKTDSRLNYYFQDLIYNVQFSQKIKPINNSWKWFNLNSLIASLLERFKQKQPEKNQNKWDFLINPSASTFSRKTEQDLLNNLIELLLAKNFKICIICLNKVIEINLYKKFKDHSKFQNILFFNPQTQIKSNLKILLKSLSQIIAKIDYRYMANILSQQNIHLRLSSDKLQPKIYAMLVWFWVAHQIDFEVAILRVEWEPYSYLIKETATVRGKKTIAFQHGVISHTLDIPVSVNRFLTFGEQSSQFLKLLNENFAKTTGQTNLCHDFRPCGSVIDDIEVLPNNFIKKTVLIIDQSVERAIQFNGLKPQLKSLEILLEKLLFQEEINKVILRPHPQAGISEFWIACKHNYPEKFELSHPKFSLSMDIRRSSIAIGLFSGALGITAASGLPTYWLKTSDGYYTHDLSCFDELTLSEVKILEDITKIMSSESLYLERRNQGLELSKKYFYNNQKAEFDEKFFKDFLEI